MEYKRLSIVSLVVSVISFIISIVLFLTFKPQLKYDTQGMPLIETAIPIIILGRIFLVIGIIGLISFIVLLILSRKK